MKPSLHAKAASVIALLAAAALPAAIQAQPVSDVEVSADGLHRVDPSIVANAWLRPDVDLSRYPYAVVMPSVVLFREMRPPSHSAWADMSETAFPVEEKMQDRLRQTFAESFHQAVTASRDFEVAERVGRDVVLIRGYLTDVATGVPPDRAGANTASVRWVWEGNLVLELRDSMSDEALVRIITRQRVEGPVQAEQVWALAPEITRRWSRWMVDQLAIIADFYPSRLQRLHEQAQETTG